MREARQPGLPYHRVIAANGLLGGYGGSIGLKRALLVAEGLTVLGTRVKQFRRQCRVARVRRSHPNRAVERPKHEPTRRACRITLRHRYHGR